MSVEQPNSPLGFCPYEVLGVSTSATDDEITAAHKLKARKCHPDVTHSDDDAMKRLNMARDAIGTAQARKEFNARVRRETPPEPQHAPHSADNFNSGPDYPQGTRPTAQEAFTVPSWGAPTPPPAPPGSPDGYYSQDTFSQPEWGTAYQPADVTQPGYLPQWPNTPFDAATQLSPQPKLKPTQVFRDDVIHERWPRFSAVLRASPFGYWWVVRRVAAALFLRQHLNMVGLIGALLYVGMLVLALGFATYYELIQPSSMDFSGFAFSVCCFGGLFVWGTGEAWRRIYVGRRTRDTSGRRVPFGWYHVFNALMAYLIISVSSNSAGGWLSATAMFGPALLQWLVVTSAIRRSKHAR